MRKREDSWSSEETGDSFLGRGGAPVGFGLSYSRKPASTAPEQASKLGRRWQITACHGRADEFGGGEREEEETEATEAASFSLPLASISFYCSFPAAEVRPTLILSTPPHTHTHTRAQRHSRQPNTFSLLCFLFQRPPAKQLCQPQP